MHTENIAYYIGSLIVLIVVFFVIKKMTSCLVKSIIMISVLVALLYIYFNYLKVG